MQKTPAELTKQGNYLIRSSHSIELIKFAILIQAGRVRRNGKGSGAQIVKKDGSWAGNAHWAMLMFLNRGLVEFVPRASGIPGSCRLTQLGKRMLDGAWARNTQITKLKTLREIDSKKID